MPGQPCTVLPVGLRLQPKMQALPVIQSRCLLDWRTSQLSALAVTPDTVCNRDHDKFETSSFGRFSSCETVRSRVRLIHDKVDLVLGAAVQRRDDLRSAGLVAGLRMDLDDSKPCETRTESLGP